MMKWHSCLRCFLLLGLLVFALPIVGQNRAIHDLVEALREEQLLQELHLERGKVEPVLKNIRAAKQLKNSYLLQKYLIENKLDALLNYPVPNQEAVSMTLQELENSRTQYYQALVKNEQELRQLLSPEEQARYVLFQRQFNKRLQELIAKIRQQNVISAEPSNQILRQQPQESVIRKPR